MGSLYPPARPVQCAPVAHTEAQVGGNIKPLGWDKERFTINDFTQDRLALEPLQVVIGALSKRG